LIVEGLFCPAQDRPQTRVRLKEEKMRRGVKQGLSWISSTVVFALLFVMLGVTQAFSQVDTGAIGGTVKDESGAVIPGATVTLTNEGTGLKLSTVTGGSGDFTFTPIRIGSYTVSAEYKGFQRVDRKHVGVQVQQHVVVNFTLPPGQITQTVEVTGAPPALQTTNASVGQVIGQRQVNNLPLNGRNYTFLAQLSAGVTQGQPETRGLNQTGDFSANGTRPAQNNYLLDGMDDNADLVDFLNGTAYVVRPPVDAIEEFKVQTSDFSAELGRAGGAVLNATLKSGTNQYHGRVWEFLRNSGLDAANFFENSNNQAKGEFRQNQFGATIGGPLSIPHVYNGKNKTFFFADYEGTRIRQASPFVNTVPTVEERASGYTDFSQLITAQSGTQTDALGRVFPLGTILDSATTRPVITGQVDPVTHMPVTQTGCTAATPCYVRDPFPGNIIPADRIDPNAVNLLNLFPLPTNGNVFSNNTTDPVIDDRIDQFDVRVDHNFSDKDQMFGAVSYSNEPTFKPGPFTGITDGGAFNQGLQTASTTTDVLSETHSFSPTLINEARLGFTRIGTSRVQPNDTNLKDIPGQYNIQDIPQVPLNGGLPAFNFNGLSTLGSNSFLPSVEYNSTIQATENLTKVYNTHTFKGGFEFQHVKFATLQPPWSRGQFQFLGVYNEVPGDSNGNTGIAQMALLPGATSVPGGINNVGGPDFVYASNIANTDDGKQYYGAYFQDTWKATSKLTLDLGVRWDYFGQVYENFGAQANFVPAAPGSAQYLIPSQRCNNAKSPLSTSFLTLTKQDGISIVCSTNQSLGNSQLNNFSPRLGFAYQVTPKLVMRGGWGMFYDGFENRGYSPNLGENYPFQFQFHFQDPDPAHPILYGNGTPATFEEGFANIPLTPTLVDASGLSLEGGQYNYITPYTEDYNFALEYEMSPNQTFTLGYVGNQAHNLEVFPGANNDSVILPPSANAQNYVPFPDFARGSSYFATEGFSNYNALQATFERRFSGGLSMLANYTYSKCLTTARDLLNGDIAGYRAPNLPGFGLQGDLGLCDFDIPHVVHFSGGYQLPVGKGQHFLSSASGLTNQILGGWQTYWILTLQDGTPFGIGCPSGTTADFGCNAFETGQPIHGNGDHNVDHWMNPAAFSQPPIFTGTTSTSYYAALGGSPSPLLGPGFHRMDLSVFKEFPISETKRFEFRCEVFNLTNTPQFGNPGFGGNGVVAAPGATDFTNLTNFGKIEATSDGAFDQREIQLALKFYW
jgi:Carboxypeptidase regulatory-like domain/TonB dependent receptor-like, beta-barrel